MQVVVVQKELITARDNERLYIDVVPTSMDTAVRVIVSVRKNHRALAPKAAIAIDKLGSAPSETPSQGPEAQAQTYACSEREGTFTTHRTIRAPPIK